MRVTGEQLRNAIMDGKKEVDALLARLYEDTINAAGQEAFDNAVEIGIANTIKALIEAGASDEKTAKITEKYWGIKHDDAIDRIVFCKRILVRDAVHEHYRLKGYSEEQIRHLWIDKDYSSVIRCHSELWSMWITPSKLVSEIEKEIRKTTVNK